MYNLTNNYSTATITCQLQADNITSICQGQFAIIPWNQDVLLAEQTIIMVCLIVITCYCLSKILLRW